MSKKEIIWREILHQAITNRKLDFTQKELARKFGVSLSTVFNALKIPRQSGSIKVTGRNFSVRDAEKFLYFWATQRNLKRDTIFETNIMTGVREAEGLMPPGIVFGAMSAYAKKYGEAPADYDKVYIYAGRKDLVEIKKRFPYQKGQTNLFVLEKDPWLEKFGPVTSDVQTFADLWNLEDWYAREFLNKLKEKLFV
ncbi:MAG: HTH domain-containing protein [Patescibacteria group bacterium]|nr:HTH domain-containing protein [Patescibacteria group bacterium]